jgi:Outer membrane lipoprotein LolB
MRLYEYSGCVTLWLPSTSDKEVPLVKQYLLPFVITGALLAGCAPKTLPPLLFSRGAVVESVQSEVSLSFSSSRGSGGGRGYLVFRKPDRSHLVILTPFGTTFMEAFTGGDRLTVIIPSKEIAYTGTFDEIPARAGLQGWKALRWIVEGEPAGNGKPDGEAVRVNREGKRETVWYNNLGLVVRKLTDEGDEAVYREYRSFDGVPFPSIIEFQDRRGTTLKIGFDEPEINRAVAESALQPRLEGMTLLSIKRMGEE